MALSFAACGGGGKKKADNELKIGVLVWKFDDAYGSTVRQGMMKYAQEIGAEKGLTINLELQDANDTMATQIDQATIMYLPEQAFL